MKTRTGLWLFLLPLFLVACSDQGGKPDAAQDALVDASDEDGRDGADGADGTDDAGGDEGLGDDFWLDVARELTACSQNWVRPGELDRTMALKAHITFRPGRIRLFADRDSFEVEDWVEKLELGPDGVQASPQGPGVFQRAFYGTEENGKIEYSLLQPFGAQGETVHLVFKVWFQVRGGLVEDRLFVLDQDALDHPFTFDDQYGYSLEVQKADATDWRLFSSCGLVAGSCQVFDFTFEGGDGLKLETCRYCPHTEVICKEDLVVIRRARFTGGASQVESDDFFLLAQSMVHHNWGTDILFVFPEPVGPTCGLYLGSMDEFYPRETSFAEVDYLNTDLQVRETRAVTGLVIGSTW